MRLTRRRSQSDGSTALQGESPLDQLFCEAYHRLHGRLLSYAERFVDRDTARDAEADAMANVWLRWSRLKPEQRTDAYFFRAVRNNVVDAKKANASRVALEDVEEELEQMAADAALAEIRREAVADVLDLALVKMPPRRREVFLLVREESFTYKEAAEALGLSEGTINTHMRLANEDLRTAFTRAGFRIAAPQQPIRLPSHRGGAK